MLVLAALACSSADTRSTGPQPAPPSTEAPAPATATFDPTQFVPAPMVSVPMAGGTLEAIPDLGAVIAADPDGDRVVVVSAATEARTIDLGANARPFRIEVEGTTAWVTLRGTGEVAEIDTSTGTLVWRAPVCPEPRGLDHAPDGTLVVACAGGELVGLDPTGSVVRTALLASDLRDVVSADGILYVSRFRPGEVLLVDPTTFATLDVAPLGVGGHVVWRMRGLETGGVIAVFDEVATDPIVAPNSSNTAPEYYVVDTSCKSLHQATFATVGPEGFATTRAKVDGVVLPVDFAIRSDESVLLVNGGAGPVSQRQEVVDVGTLTDVLDEDCLTGIDYALPGDGQPTAVTDVSGTLYAQTQGAASVVSSTGSAAPVVRWSSGAADGVPDDPFQLFHQDAGTGIACASCHPDGQDDASIWTFADSMPGVAEAGPRRTLTLAGSLAARAPYHWMGELATGPDVVNSTFTLGMGGREVAASTSDALFAWLDGVRPVHRASVASAETLARGEALFFGAGCQDCHAGSTFTNDTLQVVRPDQSAMKTPSLIGLGMRSAFLHDGCAPTLESRFVGDEACTGGDLHGKVSAFSADDVAALSAWLETL